MCAALLVWGDCSTTAQLDSRASGTLSDHAYFGDRCERLSARLGNHPPVAMTIRRAIHRTSHLVLCVVDFSMMASDLDRQAPTRSVTVSDVPTADAPPETVFFSVHGYRSMRSSTSIGMWLRARRWVLKHDFATL